MTRDIQSRREITTINGDTLQQSSELHGAQYESGHLQFVAVRVVWYLAGLIITLLIFRFMLALLAANAANGLADFVYSVSHPVVAPFFSFFQYDSTTYGGSRFEVFTLVAIGFYSVMAWGIAKLITLNKD